MKHHDSMGRVCLLRCEHTGCNFKRTSCNQADEKRVFSLPSPTAPQKQDQPGTPDQSENHTNQCSFCSRVYAKQKIFSTISDVLPSPPPSLPPHVPSGCKKMPAQDPREGPLKVRPKCGPPPVRMVRGGISSARSAAVQKNARIGPSVKAKDAIFLQFFFPIFFSNSRGEERADQPLDTRNHKSSGFRFFATAKNDGTYFGCAPLPPKNSKKN